MKIFSERVEELRGHRTQKDFAHILGIPLNTYTNWARGVRDPSLEWLVHICSALSVSSDWLLGLDPPRGDHAPAAVAETPAYERPQNPVADAAYWRGIVSSQQATIAGQQATIAELTRCLIEGRPAAVAPAKKRGAP